MKNEENAKKVMDMDIEAELSEAIKEDEINDEKSGFEALVAEKNEINEKYLRLAADFQNYKRRIENEKKEIYSYANESLIIELLDVIDNFDRAINSTNSKDVTLLEGVSMIYKQLYDILTKFGLKEIEAENCQFDPNFHHAVMRAKSDNNDSNTVIEVFQKGYTFSGKVIRPCMVKVSE